MKSHWYLQRRTLILIFVATGELLVLIMLVRYLRQQSFRWIQMVLVVIRLKNVTIQHLATLLNKISTTTRNRICIFIMYLPSQHWVIYNNNVGDTLLMLSIIFNYFLLPMPVKNFRYFHIFLIGHFYQT